MKKFWLMVPVVAVLAFGAPAFALSTEQAPVNSDGTAQFSDPDQQTPPGLVSPDSGSPGSATGSVQSYMGSPYAPQMSEMNGGRDAFDSAYNHVTNQR